MMPKTRFTEFPALSVDPRLRISRSALETNVRLFVLHMTLEVGDYHSSCPLRLHVAL